MKFFKSKNSVKSHLTKFRCLKANKSKFILFLIEKMQNNDNLIKKQPQNKAHS